MKRLLTGGVAAALSTAVHAQADPERPVRVVVTISPGSSADLLARIAEANKALAVPAVRQSLANQGFELMGGSAKDMGDFMRAEIDKWSKVVKASGAKVE